MEADASLPVGDALCLLPLDANAVGGASELAAALSRRIAVPCRMLPVAEVGTWPRLEGREQMDADVLLERLERSVPDLAKPGEALVGVTSHDIGSALFTHFFGRARRWGAAALVSLARLGPEFYGLAEDKRLLLERAEAEVMHELGHLLGLGHCRIPACVMHFAATVTAIDVRGDRYCPGCARQLPQPIAARSQ